MEKVVVTGASKGIGKAVAARFAAAGAEVAICARGIAELEAAANEIREANPDTRVLAWPCDVSVPHQRIAFAEFVHAEWSEGPDILVNNAGIFIPGQIHTEEEGVLETMLATNVHSAYHFTRLFLPGMMSRGEGHIFNMCSTASVTAYTNGGSYCISKFALYGMHQVLREEMKPHNIKVTALLPGATLTNSWAGTDLPDSRFMSAGDVAETIFMASRLSPSANIEEIRMRPVMGDI